jgi:hypothetical protein
VTVLPVTSGAARSIAWTPTSPPVTLLASILGRASPPATMPAALSVKRLSRTCPSLMSR